MNEASEGEEELLVSESTLALARPSIDRWDKHSIYKSREGPLSVQLKEQLSKIKERHPRGLHFTL